MNNFFSWRKQMEINTQTNINLMYTPVN